MYHITFTPTYRDRYPVALLVPRIQKGEIQKAYLDGTGLPPEDVLVIDAPGEPGKKKPSAAFMKQYIEEELVGVFTEANVEYILCADTEYFKTLTGAKKTEANLGYVLDCKIGTNLKVVYVPNFRAIFYDPENVRAKIARGLAALVAHRAGAYQAPGSDIIQFEAYPRTYDEIHDWLVKLLEMQCPLSIDIEAFDLKHHKAGIGTISFAWSKHEGIAFPVDYVEEEYIGLNEEGKEVPMFGRQVRNEPVRELLRAFFEQYMDRAMYHNIAYDVYVLIYQLFMTDILDTEGLLNGMDILLRNWDCTKLITYLATNSTAGNELGLKVQAQEFAGNWAQGDIHDIRLIKLDDLLRYNLVDGLSTWHVYEKHRQTVIDDQQEELYQGLFKSATLDIIQMQLTGLPLDMARTKEVAKVLKGIEDESLKLIGNTKVIEAYNFRLAEKWVEKKNSELKVKRVSLADVPDDIVFNPNSPKQLADLLFTVLGLPVLGLTATKQPETGGETIDLLRNHTTDPDVLVFLNALLDFKSVNKINTAFLPAMLGAAQGPDGWHYLFGNFNLGGTVSGRLSSSDPNLQNLPANVTMAISAALLARFGHLIATCMDKGKLHLGKLIKTCFAAPKGKVFGGLDFASLEDRISALTTKDPQKLKVYTDGYDGHCLRAHAYFGEAMPDIDPNSVASINSIETKYKSLRQDSKAPTFALTYQGTFKTLMTNCGFSEEKAKQTEARYRQLYKVSIDWVQGKLNQASKDGYITVAFGLRVRTPMLAQVIRGTRRTPYEAEAEGRTAGNALGQSWCLLNSRASAEFMTKVRKSPFRLKIRPCAHIHDAQYLLFDDDIDTLKFINEHLVQAVFWQDHPDIAHPDVPLGGEVSVFYPTWANEITIPNYATEDQIVEAITTGVEKYEEKSAEAIAALQVKAA